MINIIIKIINVKMASSKNTSKNQLDIYLTLVEPYSISTNSNYCAYVSDQGIIQLQTRRGNCVTGISVLLKNWRIVIPQVNWKGRIQQLMCVAESDDKELILQDYVKLTDQIIPHIQRTHCTDMNDLKCKLLKNIQQYCELYSKNGLKAREAGLVTKNLADNKDVDKDKQQSTTNWLCEYEAVKTEAEELRNEIVRVQKELNEAMKDEAKELQNEIARLQVALKEASTTNWLCEYEAMKTEAEELRNEISWLKVQETLNETMKAEAEELRNEIARLQKELCVVASERKSFEIEAKELLKENKEDYSELSCELNGKLFKISQLENALKQKINENRALEIEVKVLEDVKYVLNKTLNTYNENLASALSEIAKYRVENNRLEELLETTQVESNKLIIAIDRHSDEVKKENDRLVVVKNRVPVEIKDLVNSTCRFIWLKPNHSEIAGTATCNLLEYVKEQNPESILVNDVKDIQKPGLYLLDVNSTLEIIKCEEIPVVVKGWIVNGQTNEIKTTTIASYRQITIE